MVVGFAVLGLNSTPAKLVHYLPGAASATEECAKIVVLSLVHSAGGPADTHSPMLASIEVARTHFGGKQVTALCGHGEYILAAIGCLLVALNLTRLPCPHTGGSTSYVLQRVPKCTHVRQCFFFSRNIG